MVADPSAFRQFLFPHDHPRLAELRGLDPYQYRQVAASQPFTGGLIHGWTPLYLNEFTGITEDGTLRADLFALSEPEPGEEAPVEAMVAAARGLLGLLTDDQREQLVHDIDSPQWQTWSNPEFLQFDTGLRLEFQSEPVRRAVLDLMKASMSSSGYDAVRRTMQINGFLGSLVDLEPILNEFSYNFAVYGVPDPQQPWGWQLFGHHCAVNCVVVDGHLQISPVFLGAEPDQIDEGPLAGPGVFDKRLELARRFMTLLPSSARRRALAYESLVDPAMPPDRIHPGDERHLAGAFQDNRIIPCEGLPLTEATEDARDVLLQFVEEYFDLLAAGPRAERMRLVRAHLGETWVSWIGGHGASDPFYIRVQSPVVLAELDHHCGVFLDYDTPQVFHVHTVLRTPHGNDYGRAWVRQWQARQAQSSPVARDGNR